MSLSAFVAGLALGGLQYGAVRLQLLERETVVLYSVHQVKESLENYGHKKQNKGRYGALPSYEHEFYTYIRTGWNSKVLAFRKKMYELFETK